MSTPSGIVEPAQAAEAIGVVCDEGYRRWEQCLHLARGTDENFVILQTHYHLLEQLDAVQVLVFAGAVEPSKLQLRAAFEALLTIEFVLQSDTRRRAYAWLVVADILERIRTWDRFDPSTNSGREFAELLKREGISFPTIVTAKESRTDLQQMLETDSRWTEAYAEYLRVKKALTKRRPEWYELFGGPAGPGLRNLALYLGHGAYYEIIYRLWSRRMHGTDVVQRVKPGSKPGTMAIEPKRYAADVNTVLNYSLSFGLWSTRVLIGYYVPKDGPAFAAWYRENVQARWPLVSPVP